MSNVQVAVRARPLSKREVEAKGKVIIEMRNKSTIVSKTISGLTVGELKTDSKEFLYDYSYWSVDLHDNHFASQEQVYGDLGKSVLESAFQGYNACVFAYGQTGSGKTYTMMGSEESPGLIPRICESLFAHIENGSKKNVSYRVEASYMEIYNEKVRDLLKATTTLAKSQQLHNLKIREHPKEGPYVENLSRHTVCDYDSISSLMKMGNSLRVTASTKMNDVSSRSHAIFTLVFSQAAYSSDLPCETVSKIHLVDLAGSERASATGAEGIRLKEGGNINRSLACLGNVISALADLSSMSRRSKGGDNKKPFIPYRDSVLTWLLKDSLGGNSKTIMVATVSPAEENYGETLSTLRYASRAKNIVNKPVVNEDDNVRLIRELKSEIKRLKGIITAAKLEDSDLQLGESALEQNIHKKEEMIAELTKSWAGKWDEDLQRAVEERNLAWHSEGIKMTLGSERPHLLTVDNDVYGGVVIYHLKNGRTSIGAKDTSPEPDIALNGEDIEPHHCSIAVEDQQNSKVRLMLDEGECFVNHTLTTEDSDLSHGDLLQLGKMTVFRFNHPEEARKLKDKSLMHRSSLLPLSPISSSVAPDSCRIQIEEELEEQKEALERDYNQKMERMREELERKNEEDRARLVQELEELKQQMMSTPTSKDDSQSDDEDEDDDDDLRRNSAYELMQSIAYTPVTTRRFNPHISDRVVVGRERDASLSPYRFITSPDSDDSPCSSPRRFSMSSTPDTSPENRHRKTTIIQDEIDEDTMDISIVEVSDSPMYPSNVEMGFTMLSHGDAASPTEEDGGEESVDSGAVLSTPTISAASIETCPAAAGATDVCELRLKLTQEQLRDREEEFQKIEREKREVVSKLTEVERKERSLRHHMNDQQVHHRSEQRVMRSKLDQLQEELFRKELESTRGRGRSNAFTGTPEPQRPKRSQSASRSLRYTSRRIQVEVPGYLLRGDGWGAYYVFEVRLNVGEDKWSVYKSYPQFKMFHEEIIRRYSQLSVLSFPPSKWFGFKNRIFLEQRRTKLQSYMQSLLTLVTTLPTCPLYEISSRHLSKDKIITFNSFFNDGKQTGL